MANNAVIRPVFQIHNALVTFMAVVTTILPIILLHGCSSLGLRGLGMIRIDLQNADFTLLLPSDYNITSFDSITDGSISRFNYFGIGGVCFGDTGNINEITRCSNKYKASGGVQFASAIFNNYDLTGINTSYPDLFTGYDFNKGYRTIFEVTRVSAILSGVSVPFFFLCIIYPWSGFPLAIGGFIHVIGMFMMLASIVTAQTAHIRLQDDFERTYSSFGIISKLPIGFYIIAYITTGMSIAYFIWIFFEMKVLTDLIVLLGGPQARKVDVGDGETKRYQWIYDDYPDERAQQKWEERRRRRRKSSDVEIDPAILRDMPTDRPANIYIKYFGTVLGAPRFEMRVISVDQDEEAQNQHRGITITSHGEDGAPLIPPTIPPRAVPPSRRPPPPTPSLSPLPPSRPLNPYTHYEQPDSTGFVDHVQSFPPPTEYRVNGNGPGRSAYGNRW